MKSLELGLPGKKKMDQSLHYLFKEGLLKKFKKKKEKKRKKIEKKKKKAINTFREVILASVVYISCKRFCIIFS